MSQSLTLFDASLCLFGEINRSQFVCFVPQKQRPKRVKAIYNCVADNPDELTFSEGEVIVVDGEEDQEWWVSIPDSLHSRPPPTPRLWCRGPTPCELTSSGEPPRVNGHRLGLVSPLR